MWVGYVFVGVLLVAVIYLSLFIAIQLALWKTGIMHTGLHKPFYSESLFFNLISPAFFISNCHVPVSKGVAYCNMWRKSNCSEIRWLTVRGECREDSLLGCQLGKACYFTGVFSSVLLHFNFDPLLGLCLQQNVHYLCKAALLFLQGKCL